MSNACCCKYWLQTCFYQFFYSELDACTFGLNQMNMVKSDESTKSYQFTMLVFVNSFYS